MKLLSIVLLLSTIILVEDFKFKLNRLSVKVQRICKESCINYLPLNRPTLLKLNLNIFFFMLNFYTVCPVRSADVNLEQSVTTLRNIISTLETDYVDTLGTFDLKSFHRFPSTTFYFLRYAKNG